MNKLKKVAISLAVTTFVIMSLKTSLGTTGKVNVKTVRVRAAANTESEILDRASEGTEIEVLGLEGDWYKVKFNEKEGYIHKNYLNVADETTETAVVATENNEDVKEEIATNTETTEEPKEEKVMELGDTLNKATSAYKLPNFMSSQIMNIEAGKQIKITTTMANWAKIELDGKEGWLPKTYLMREVTVDQTMEQPTETQPVEQPAEQPVEQPVPVQTETPVNKAGYISSSAAANLRSGPSTDTASIGKLTHNTKLTIVADTGEWYKVNYNGKAGYIFKQLVAEGEPPVETSSRSQEEPRQTTTVAAAPATTAAQPAPAAASGSVIQVAQQYLGTRYVMGGSSPSSGFDCSGFTSYVYGQCGRSISRTSYTQANEGVAVDKSNLQAGDLLLFKTNGANGGISHVGIYVGNGQFIHAANPSRGVVYDTINSGYYNTNYAGARRVM